MIEGRQEDTPYMNIVEQQKSFFLSGKTHQISFRLNRLDQLARIIEEMEIEESPTSASLSTAFAP